MYYDKTGRYVTHQRPTAPLSLVPQQPIVPSPAPRPRLEGIPVRYTNGPHQVEAVIPNWFAAVCLVGVAAYVLKE